ncbi:MAG: AAA family ATPase, partial [Sutterella sp.]
MTYVSGTDVFLGSDLFADLRREGRCYVDKTAFIERLVGRNAASVSLITRPRRFGKSLMLSMLNEFFRIDGDTKNLFEGLHIAENKALCRKWMNSRPVIFFSLNIGEMANFSLFLENYAIKFKRYLDRFPFLVQSDKLTPGQKEDLLKLASGSADESLLRNSLFLLIQA